ncbi:MFS transporter [Candidatus Gromoviella agglomerans]|uniref:MFS transporter n=1 Tax=Candidatus Gromoviella agglomerans TaxID=2806609 RepID=UPI001E612090|nr:MFS transporter [Candidatus Gromoviella agglomerans]UFX98617.1 MFS family permease protein [Candidatus Gromoviella agglomerans]
MHNKSVEANKNNSMMQILISCMIGNAIEWYDFALYGFFAPTFGKLFFPESDTVASLMASLGIFAMGFVMRPIGAVFFGHIGDKLGRSKSLIISMYMMAIPTAAISVLPTYEMVGWLAPLLLTIIRLMQGFSMGGEFTGSMIFVSEHSPNNKRGLYGSWIIFSVVFGTLIGSCISSLLFFLLSNHQIMSWGWRIPFVISIMGGLIGKKLRQQVSESKEFISMKKSNTPLLDVMKNYKKNVGIVMLIDMTVAIGFFIITLFVPSYLQTIVGIESKISLLINTIGMTCFAITVPIIGQFLDKFSKIKIMMISCVLFFIFSYISFCYFFDTSMVKVCIAYCFLTINMGIYYAPLSSLLSEIFPLNIRYSGVSISHNLSMTIFGGTAPVLMAMFSKYNILAPSFYLMFAGVVSFIGLIALKNNKVQYTLQS